MNEDFSVAAIEKEKETIAKANELLPTHFLQLKNKYISSDIANKANINAILNMAIEKNKSVLYFLDILLDNYKVDNNAMYINIKDNSNLYIYKYIEGNDAIRIVAYLSNYNFTSFNPIKTINTSCVVTSFLLLRDALLAVATKANEIRIFDPSNDFVSELTIRTKEPVNSMAQLENGNLLSAQLSTLCEWKIEAKSHSCKKTIDIPKQIVKMGTLEGDRIAVITVDELKVLDSDEYFKIESWYLPSEKFCAMEVCRDNNIVITAGMTSIKIWSMKPYKLMKTFEESYCCALNGIFHFDVNRAVIGIDGSLYVVDLIERHYSLSASSQLKRLNQSS